MTTIEQIIAAQKAAQNKTEASKKASAASKSAAQAKATKERAKKTTASDAEQSAFVAASTAGSELLQALGDFKRGRITKQEADKKLTAFNASLSVLKGLNPDRAKAVESAVLPPNVTAELKPKIITAPPAVSDSNKKVSAKPTVTSISPKPKTTQTVVEPVTGTFEEVGAKPFTQPMTLAGAGQFGTSAATGINKIDSAIAKAIELYQMPDIIFNNVPELRTILDKYLDPNKPITLDQFVKEVANSTWYRQNSKTIQNRYLQKFNYDELKKNGQATGNTQYEQDIKRITETIISKAREIGALDYTDPTAAQLIAEDLYIHNMEADTTALTKRLAGAIRTGVLGLTGAKGYTGSAQANYQSLLTLAKNNGLSLKSILPSRIAGATDEELTNNVLKGLADGSLSMDTIEQTAKILASEGKPQYVKDLLNQGYDLRDIYASYINKMATAFEVDASTIELNDPLLRQAFTDKGATKLNDFQTLIENDSRFTGTSSALKQTNNKESALKQLNQVAKANGIDLNSKYGEQVNGWINDILKGKDVNSIAQIIRNDASAGKSKYVKDQLALGNDLRDIYSNYINQMATAFGIDADSIDVNDPLLANVFTENGPINNVTFKNLLRNDQRYKGTAGAIGEGQTLQSIKDIAVQFGADLTDEDAASILETAASKGLNANSPEIVNLIRGKIAYKPGATLKGAAGGNLQDLRNTAMANGMDLDKMFNSNVQDWLQKIAQGESIDTFKKIIRETAKVGLPDNVKKLMDQGIDLNTVYSPYRSMMGSVLEIDPNTIDINDPILRGAIGPDKEMSLYEWQRALRKDPRWQYTNNAKAEVSSAVQGVLKDFGFVG